MDAPLASLFSLYTFSTGRRLFALQQVQEAALASDFGVLADHCGLAIAHDRVTRELEARWAGQKDAPQLDLDAKQIDILVDAALAGVRDILELQARVSVHDDPLGSVAIALSQELFPKGVSAITSAPFVEELAELDRIVRRLQDSSEQLMHDLGLARHISRLVTLEKRYRAAIEGPSDKVSFNAVKDARAKGQSLLLQAVAIVLGKHPSDGPGDSGARATLVSPILKQNEIIRDFLRSRRSVEDIDPDTGEIESNPASAAASASASGGQG